MVRVPLGRDTILRNRSHHINEMCRYLHSTLPSVKQLINLVPGFLDTLSMLPLNCLPLRLPTFLVLNWSANVALSVLILSAYTNSTAFCADLSILASAPCELCSSSDPDSEACAATGWLLRILLVAMMRLSTRFIAES